MNLKEEVERLRLEHYNWKMIDGCVCTGGRFCNTGLLLRYIEDLEARYSFVVDNIKSG